MLGLARPRAAGRGFRAGTTQRRERHDLQRSHQAPGQGLEATALGRAYGPEPPPRLTIGSANSLDQQPEDYMFLHDWQGTDDFKIVKYFKNKLKWYKIQIAASEVKVC